MSLRFTWDPNKATQNLRKHQVNFDEATTVFGDPFAGIEDDPDHSIDEQRYLIIGYSSRNRLLIVIFTEPIPDAIRIISARLATNTERKKYEKYTR